MSWRPRGRARDQLAAGLLGGAVVMSLAAVAIALANTSAAAQVDHRAAQRYLQLLGSTGVELAPTHEWTALAAGYDVCGELARGASPALVVTRGRAEGLGGARLPPGQVPTVVATAERYLCGDVDER